MEPGIPFSPALIAVRWRKWKITVLAWTEQGDRQLWCLVRALLSGRMSQLPLFPCEPPAGSWGIEPKPGGCRGQRDGHEGGGGEEWIPREPPGKVPLPWANFLMAQGA